MGSSGNEYRLLAPLIPAFLIVPLMALVGVESVDAAFLIVLAPFMAFPVSYTHLTLPTIYSV